MGRVVTGAELTAIGAIVAAVALLVERLTSLTVARAGRRKAAVEPTQLIANAAATLVASVDDIVAPLRAEIAELRAVNKTLSVEVAALRATLAAHGIPVPPIPLP